ncbi:MAG TPA: glycosyltransferase family 2 protein [Myxococcales bacterium]|nr:glycosyltransferase family 2 protein [Myxococcales bacterium]
MGLMMSAALSGASCTPEDRHVVVLLATFNGELYLDALLTSIFSQTHTKFTVVARDDGSSDSTLDILQEYAARFESRLVLLTAAQAPATGRYRRGSIANYAALLAYLVSAEGQANFENSDVVFADQDDIWKVEKLSVMLIALVAEETDAQPVLIYSDLEIVDSSAEQLSGSFYHYQNTSPNRISINYLLPQNCVVGCASMMNWPLITLATPLPESVCMHDHWIALVASSMGRAKHISERLVLYRQHDGNDVGAKRWGLGYILAKLSHYFTGVDDRESLAAYILQSQALLARYDRVLAPKQRDIVKNFSRIRQGNMFYRRWVMIKYRIYRAGLVRSLVLFMEL